MLDDIHATVIITIRVGVRVEPESSRDERAPDVIVAVSEDIMAAFCF